MNDVQQILRYRFCVRKAGELGFYIKLMGYSFELYRSSSNQLEAVFKDLDALYNYILGHESGLNRAE